MELETDEKGLVTFLPLVSWGVTLVQGKTVGLLIDYYANADDIAAQKVTRRQLALDRAGALALGRSLISRAEQLPPVGGDGEG
ncbi:MAG TPA: hypothetical protein VFE13_04600 [Caulobacteraceae bacterium]|jgi:hypothetical protein|nr:hypothetical protein [Caulobacteraceae bacterium]